MRWQVRVRLRPFICEGETSKAEHGGLPKAPKGRSVNATGCITHVIGQIDLHRLPEVALRGVRHLPGAPP